MKLTRRIQAFLNENPLTWEDAYDIDLSSVITTARVTSGLTQEELAKRAETTQSSIARAESGSVLPSHGLLKKVARAVGASLTAPRLSFEDTAYTALSFAQYNTEFQFRPKSNFISSISGTRMTSYKSLVTN